MQEGEQVEQPEAFCVSGWALLTGREAETPDKRRPLPFVRTTWEGDPRRTVSAGSLLLSTTHNVCTGVLKAVPEGVYGGLQSRRSPGTQHGSRAAH